DDRQFASDGAHALFHNQWTPARFFQFSMSQFARKREATPIIFDGERPAAALARQSYKYILGRAMAANIGQGLAQNSGEFAANWRWQIDLRNIAYKLCADAGVLPVTRDHARKKINQMAGIKIERLELLN